MAFRFAFFALVCIAQGFAFQPLGLVRQNDACKGSDVPHQFEESINQMDDIRETVSMAALDSYGVKEDIQVVIACFRQEGPNYVRLGARISEMYRNASEELAQKLGEKAQKYEKLIQVPLRKIAVTLQALPEKVFNFIKNQEFGKAFEAMKAARIVVEENSRIIGGYLREMAGEVPEIADRAEELAKQIAEESRRGANAIRESFRKCVKEGGPKKPEESESDSEE